MANDLTLASGALVARIETLGVGRALAMAMPASVATAMHGRTIAITGSDGQLERIEVGDLAVRRGVPIEDLRQALEVARRACKPAGPTDAYAALMPLLSIAARRAEAELDAKLRREVYSSELAPYPASGVAEAARRIMRRSPYWPHISELITEVERVMAPRRQLLRALERALAEADAPKPGRQISRPEPPSRAERLRDVVATWTKRGERHRAASAELELVKIEGRAPAEWATRPKPPPPKAAPRAMTKMELELAELAERRRRQLLGDK